MTQRTINLYDGLEALYYFDSDYFDGTTGEIEDKSGHERHATAVGGPTISDDGYHGFGEASFDGVDDEFTGPRLDEGGQITLAAQMKGGSNALDRSFHTLYNSDRNAFWFNNGNFQFKLTDGGGNKSIEYWLSPSEKTWYTVVGTWDGQTQSILVDGDVKSQKQLSTRTIGKSFSIGDRNFGGSISWFGKWNRSISYAEIQHLNRLTAPRRAQL